MSDDELTFLLRRIVTNARMPRSRAEFLDPDWVIVPRDLIEQLADILPPQDEDEE